MDYLQRAIVTNHCGVALVLIISESIPLPAVAILILVMEVILGVDDADGVASSFMSDAVFLLWVP